MAKSPCLLFTELFFYISSKEIIAERFFRKFSTIMTCSKVDFILDIHHIFTFLPLKWFGFTEIP